MYTTITNQITMTTQEEKELREAFLNHRELAGQHGYCNPIFAAKIADWWLTKLKSHDAEMVGRVEALRRSVKHDPECLASIESEKYCDCGLKTYLEGHHSVLNEVLALFNHEK